MVLSRDTLELLGLIRQKDESELHRTKATLQQWKKVSRTLKLKLQKTRLRKAQEDVEARRHNLPPILTSLHSSPLAAPLLISLYTIHNVNDTVQSDTSGDEIVISSPTTPEPEASSLDIVLDQIISTPRL